MEDDVSSVGAGLDNRVLFGWLRGEHLVSLVTKSF